MRRTLLKRVDIPTGEVAADAGDGVVREGAGKRGWFGRQRGCWDPGLGW